MDFKYSTNIRKKDNGWQYIITYKTSNMPKWKPKSKQGFKTKNDANKAMIEMIPILEKQVKNENVISDKVTLEKFFNVYIDHIKIYREYGTIENFETCLKAFSGLKNKELTKIKTSDIQKCIDKMTCDNLKESTIKVYLGKLKTILKAAKEDYNLISEIPKMSNIKIKEDKTKKEKKALNKKDIDQMLFLFKGTDYYLIVLIAVKCGLRIGEIMGLTWEDIDYKSNIIRVNKQWKKIEGGFGFGVVKGKNSNREVPMPRILSNELKKCNCIEGRIFNNYSTSAVRLNLNRKLKKFDISIHELRHTYATTLIANNMDLKTVAYLMGHDIKQTFETYSHVTEDMKIKANNKIREIL